MRWIPLLLTLAFSAWSCAREEAPGTPSPPAPSVVVGRVVDDSGEGVASVQLTLSDTTRFTGYVDSHGCGTYHPQGSAETGPDGRFRVELPFTPNMVSISQAPKDFDASSSWLRVTPGEEVSLTVQRIHWLVYEGQVVDETGAPLAQVHVDQGESTDAGGHFQLKVRADSAHDQFRFRKMGFKPIFVPEGELAKVTLRERRTLVTVKLLDKTTKEPAGSLFRVSAHRGSERLSFCTAGDMAMTHEPVGGQCVLDAEPGQVELRVEDKPVRMIEVTAAPQEVTLEVSPPPALPPGSNPY
jgi:hypothetical protein